MLTPKENERLTLTDPGTPGGALLRRYWQPVALSSELRPFAPIPTKLMGEDLVLFRDDDGQPGLLGRTCPHRGVDLSYGRCEDGGLRCVYHGWLFARDGAVCIRGLFSPAEIEMAARGIERNLRAPSERAKVASAADDASTGPGGESLASP